MMEIYDRDGVPITMSKWRELMEDDEYRKVVRTEFPDGEFVSTVWLGLNHGFGDGIKIFETMSFEKDDWKEQVRYSTVEEAKKGHLEVVARVEARRALRAHPYYRVVEADQPSSEE